MRTSYLGAVAAALLCIANIGAAEAQPRGGPPSGSYLRSCGDVYVDRDGILNARCRQANGDWHPTRLRLSTCRPGDIRNDNGNLDCPRRADWDNRPPPPPYGGRPGGPPPGPAPAVVFSESDFRGSAMRIEGRIDNMRDAGFNDAVSSMRLGRARWEVCSDAYFRGHCQVFSGDVRSLRRSGFNNSISSMRRID